MQLLNPQCSKMTPPNFGANSLSSPSTVFQGKWPNQGGGPQDHPKKRQFVAQTPFGARNGHLEGKSSQLKAQNGHLEATNGHLEAPKGNLEATRGYLGPFAS